MKIFQVNISLPREFSDEFVSLIPHQRRLVSHLLDKKVLESFAISADRSKAWAAVNASNEKEVRDLLATFPLIRWMKVEILELSYYNQVQLAFPPIIMN